MGDKWLASSIEHRASSIEHRASSIEHPMGCGCYGGGFVNLGLKYRN
jgi:hypothetical protein